MPVTTRTALENLLDHPMVAHDLTGSLAVQTLPPQGHVAARVWHDRIVRKAAQVRIWQKHGTMPVKAEMDTFATHVETYAPHVDMQALETAMRIAMSAVADTHAMYADDNAGE